MNKLGHVRGYDLISRFWRAKTRPVKNLFPFFSFRLSDHVHAKIPSSKKVSAI